MLHLFLLRHGKATKYQDDTTDFSRSLNKQGTAQVNQIGYILRESGVKIDHILSSSAVRTTETTEIANHFLGCKSVVLDRQLYLADKNSILKKINSSGKGKKVLYVGHNNGISDLASSLTNQQIDLSTSELVEITFETDNWQLVSAGTGSLKMRLKPDVHSN